MKSDTISRLFRERVLLSGDRLAIKKKAKGKWVDISWREYGENVRRFALGLLSMGLEPRTSVCVLGDNMPEWVYADIAVMSVGSVTVPIYQTNTAEQVKYIHGNLGKGTFTFYGGHDPEDYQHFVGDPPTELALHKNSPGYRLILNNVLFPAARKKKLKT